MGAPEQPAKPAPLLGRAQIAVAVGVVAIFVAMLVAMALLRADKNWDRLVYLLSGFEAIVFAAVGALFGVTVQRGAVVTARQDAADARKDADQARHKADTKADEAAAGRALSEAVQAKRARRRPRSGARMGARPEDEPETDGSPESDDLDDLAELARRLFHQD
jgi:hypothetical protein